MSAKVVVPILVGLVGASAATTALTTNVFSFPKKCWYDGEEPGSFLKEVEKILEKNHGGKDNSKLKDFIGTLCTVDPESSLDKFNEVFEKREGNELLNGVFGLLLEKLLELHKQKNLEQNKELELGTVL